MCVGVQYTIGDREYRILFKQPTAQLPVSTRRGPILTAWGRRPKQKGRLPLGGCAFRDAVLAGNWDRFFPKAVRLRVAAFAVTDIEGKIHWQDLTTGKWIKGCIARDGPERRVYVVTIAPSLVDTPYERWPLIASG